MFFSTTKTIYHVWRTSFRHSMVLFALSVVLFSSCVNGPIRCHLNGRFKYLSVEATKQTAWYTYPITIPAAVLCDTGIVLADTITIPVLSLGHLGPDGKSHPLWSIFWLPFHPLVCGMYMIGNYDSLYDGWLYQKLFGYHYFSSPFGNIKIINAEKADGLQRFILELDGHVICNLYGQINNLAVNSGNVVFCLDIGAMHWLRLRNGKWESALYQLMPDNTLLTNAIESKIRELTNDLQEWSEEYQIKIKKEIDRWYAINRILKTNENNVLIETIRQPRFTENKKDELEYALKVICQAYDFNVICVRNGNIMSVVMVY